MAIDNDMYTVEYNLANASDYTIQQPDKIVIDYGVSTELEIDLSDYDFTGVQKVIFQIKNYINEESVVEREFTSAGVYIITITPVESRKIIGGAMFDFNSITISGDRFKISDNGVVEIREGVGQCQ